MRWFGCLLLMAAGAFAHGGSMRTPQPTNTIPVVPFGSGGGPTTPGEHGPPGSSTPGDSASAHTWRDWWAYNAEYLIATRHFQRTVTPRPQLDNAARERRRVRDERIESQLLRALEDKSHSVRAAAAIALGKIGKPEFLKPLLRHASLPAEGWYDVREASIYAIGLLGQEENRAWALALAADDDTGIRERSIALFPLLMDGSGKSVASLKFHLEYRKSGIVSLPELLPQRAEEERRRFAAHLLGFVTEHDVDRALWGSVSNTKRSADGERAFAVAALGRRGSKDYLRDLFRIANDRQENDQVRRAAVIGLGQLVEPGDSDSVDRLAMLVREDRKDEIRRQFACMALAEVGGARALDRLLAMGRDNVFASDDSRGFLYLAIGIAGDKSPDARAWLLGEFRQARSAERRAPLAVAMALAKQVDGGPEIRDRLEKTSLASGGEFLAYGSLALGMLGAPGAGDTIRGILKKYADPLVRRQSAIGLALLEREGALPDLIELLEKTGTNFTRAAVVSALGMLQDPSKKTVDALIEAAFTDKYEDSVRSRAISALGAIADPREIPFSAILSRGYNYLVRCHALDEIATWL